VGLKYTNVGLGSRSTAGILDVPVEVIPVSPV
jgi:hypothetical protein